MTKEEYASKLRLLQQEYDKLKAGCLEDYTNVSKQYMALLAEHAALKEKAEKMVYALQISDRYIRNDQYGEWANEAAAIRDEIRTALSSYNSNTNNQNENDG